MRDPNVVLIVDSNTGHRTENPVVRQWLRPQWIHFEGGRLGSAGSLSGCCLFKHTLTDSERDEKCDEGDTNIKTTLHIAHLLPLFSDASCAVISAAARAP